MIQQTSLQAYNDLKKSFELGKRQKLVFDGIKTYPDITANELARKLGKLDPNYVRPRIKELVDLGLVFSSGNRGCSVTKKNVLVWRVSYGATGDNNNNNNNNNNMYV